VPFKKGEGGRPRGVRNKATVEVEARCRALVEAADYQADFMRRLKAGQLPPQLEALTWHYAYGKPVERQEISGPDGGPIPIEVHDHFAVAAPR
jgi:hypothetical protein